MKAPRPKRPVPVKSKVGKAGFPRFETVLNSLDPDTKAVPPMRKKNVEPYENYCRYMAVKRKIRSARLRSKNIGTGRVEEVGPIQRVQRVQRVRPLGGE